MCGASFLGTLRFAARRSSAVPRASVRHPGSGRVDGTFATEGKATPQRPRIGYYGGHICARWGADRRGAARVRISLDQGRRASRSRVARGPDRGHVQRSGPRTGEIDLTRKETSTHAHPPRAPLRMSVSPVVPDARPLERSSTLGGMRPIDSGGPCGAGCPRKGTARRPARHNAKSPERGRRTSPSPQEEGRHRPPLTAP